MNKTVAALEIGSSSARFAVGYVSKHRPEIIYRAERPLEGLVSRGDIKDSAGLSKVLSAFASIEDEETRLKLDTDELCVVLPPLGLEIYQNNKTTNVIGEAVDTLATTNAMTLIRKDRIPSGNEIVDIVPDCFILENGKAYRNPPYGERSNTLTIQSKVHAVPSSLIRQYSQAVQGAGFRSRRMCLAPYCATELLASDAALPPSYFLIDMGADLTTVSLVGEKMLYCSFMVLMGGKALSNALMEKFGLPFEEANALKERYGYDDRERAFAPVLGRDGKELKSVARKDLAAAVSGFFDSYLSQINNAIDLAIKKEAGEQDPRFQALPLVLIGGASRLYGLDKLFKKAFSARETIRYTPKVMGARDPKMANLLGLLLASGDPRGTLEDNFRGVTPLARE